MTCGSSVRKELPEYVIVGFVERPFGITGEMKVKPITDFPERFNKLKTVFVELKGGSCEKFRITKATLREHSVYLILKGIDTREQAQKLRGGLLKIPLDQVVPLAADEFYHFEIIGFEVSNTSGQHLGVVEEVMALPANDVLVVKNGDRDHLIPMIADVIKKIDRESQQIIIEVIDGLLD